MSAKRLDVICLGRAAVDLYGEQLGASLAETQTFAKYVGGSAANIAVGAARQGLRVGMLTRVGDEPMGRFVRETLAGEGIDVSEVSVDKERLTGLVLLAIRDRHTFPLIFYRERCADMALAPEHIHREYVASATTLVVTGTHFSAPQVDAASRQAIAFAREVGTRVVLDIDYRPVLWGLGGHGTGDARYVASDRVSKHLQTIVGLCDVVVGTEEEIHVAGGVDDTVGALRRLRELSRAVLVVKRGAAGSVIFAGAIPARLEDGLVVAPYRVEVLNVLGAGDAFLAGFLRGYVGGEPLLRCGQYGNAGGALVVSRHGCAPAMPSRAELGHFLAAPDDLATVARLHYGATRKGSWPELCVFALDNRLALEARAAQVGAPVEKLARLKTLLARGALAAAQQVSGVSIGVIIDDRYGAEALAAVRGRGFLVARPIEVAGEIPLAFEPGTEVGLALRSWPAGDVVKCLVRMHPHDPGERSDTQLARLKQLFTATRATGHELLLEVLPPEGATLKAAELAPLIENIYAAGVEPDWWKLAPQESAAAWRTLAALVRAHDAACRGILVLGGGLGLEDLDQSFALAAKEPLCQGFAVGRTIFGEPAEGYLKGVLAEPDVVRLTAERFARVVALWQAHREVSP